ncbi:Uncharacterized protein YcnI [Amycolatopsis arida]|uniref:Uncharacterized protein YcnI n=1 Tax=Amycolatopsis arida TaxID=587909 RepID=A0A1I5TZJ7_9PSEU|nr:YcnI family protein [Amycolatopsis arida]TDX95898.1 uncharacterized protein YcnI [Amycolatopsis arida]SFP88331.1 Uncharacterized protein YcnI [Amycolatopsis arida]
MSTNRFLRRAGVLSAAVATAGLLTTGVAAAHVTANVYGKQPAQGGYGAIVLRVPNEKADAGTVKLEVTLPTEYALSSVRTKPVPGWTADVAKTTLSEPVRNGRGAEVTEVATKITWTAQGDTRIAGNDEYQEFPFTAGPLPTNVDTLVLPAAQTYDNGDVVNWDAPPPAEGAEEPEHPAPVVELAPASEAGHGTGKPDEHDTTDQAAADADDDTARWLGGAGLAVGALGLGVGVGALLRARKATSAVKEER